MLIRMKKENIIKIKKCVKLYEMGNKVISFGDIEIAKSKFYRYKNPTFLNNVDINNMLISNKISSSEKDYL